MEHRNNSGHDLDAEVDLNFAAAPPRGVLPEAVDENGMPVALDQLADATWAPGQASSVADSRPVPADVSPGAPLSASAVADLPRGDWTKVGSDGRKLMPSNPRNSALAKAIIAMLLLMLLVPMVLALLSMPGDLGSTAP